ncbi:bifunctional folylpolyglutamate synthase/dihydrofolate synthase [Desertivirga xinjiangensis]|uniref:bifunctional folylpolyglutamate synthase/dihydrofolate synthase n=1 Tax=Desertivirga xinjiangensis TaxID=539206 RepID=UPI00210B3279|nr:folylpolyglutamate synthase/dihydrofolate synthase family protein [Pedobacter xinjiangensis]
MTYTETLDYLYSKLPMFSKMGAQAIKKDLTNTQQLCDGLGNPHRRFKSIHVAGTNGKGSVSHMLAAVLQSAGYKTGLYTSPHLRDFRERIRINGEMITEEAVIRFVESQRTSIEQIEPSFFEVTVAMAFNHFAEQQVDIAVIETGLGGRLDSTNIILPELSVITNIGFDHMNILGDTLPKIAFEKAGIIKPGTPVVLSEKQEITDYVFINKAKECGSTIIFASDEWQIEDIGPQAEPGLELREIEVSTIGNQFQASGSFKIELDLTGYYQLKNVKAVLSSVKVLREKGYVISEESILNALKQVKTLTGLQGRWQTLSKEGPLVICDTGHNEDGIKEVIKNIEATSFEQLHIVIGMVKDKDVSKVLSLLPTNAIYYFCQPMIERAKPAADLASEASSFNLKGHVYASVALALEEAKRNAAKGDLIFIGGSTFVVAEIVPTSI